MSDPRYGKGLHLLKERFTGEVLKVRIGKEILKSTNTQRKEDKTIRIQA